MATEVLRKRGDVRLFERLSNEIYKTFIYLKNSKKGRLDFYEEKNDRIPTGYFYCFLVMDVIIRSTSDGPEQVVEWRTRVAVDTSKSSSKYQTTYGSKIQ